MTTILSVLFALLDMSLPSPAPVPRNTVCSLLLSLFFLRSIQPWPSSPFLDIITRLLPKGRPLNTMNKVMSSHASKAAGFWTSIMSSPPSNCTVGIPLNPVVSSLGSRLSDAWYVVAKFSLPLRSPQ